MKAGFLNGKLSTKQVILEAKNIFHNARWFNGIVVCPYCGEVHKIYQAKDGSYSYKCGKCNKKFSDRTKTLLHGSKLSTETWMQGIYEVFTDNFITSTQLAIKLHINQKSAWLMLAKIRYGLLQDDYLLGNYIAVSTTMLLYSHTNIHKIDQNNNKNKKKPARKFAGFNFFVVPLHSRSVPTIHCLLTNKTTEL